MSAPDRDELVAAARLVQLLRWRALSRALRGAPSSLLCALLQCRVPGWAAGWPADSSPENEAELVRSCALWRASLDREPTPLRALLLVQQQLGAVLGLEPVGAELAAARAELLLRASDVAAGRS